METKINRQPTYNHPDFIILVKSIQNKRILKGKETSQTRIALWKLTKTIANYLEANPNAIQKIVEVDIPL